MLEVHEDQLGLPDLTSDDESITDSRVSLADAQTEIFRQQLERLRAENLMAERIDQSQNDAAQEPLLIRSDQNQEAPNPALGKMRTCDVCYEESDETSFFGLRCKHDYCQECMKDHLDSNI